MSRSADTQQPSSSVADPAAAGLASRLVRRMRLMLEMIRFSHTIFALPFALLAALMAWQVHSAEINSSIDAANAMARSIPLLDGEAMDGRVALLVPSELLPREPAWRWQELAGILLCMVFARSAAMAFNRLVDRRIDALNPRTAGRHLPSGLLSVRSVVLFALGCSVGFVASTLLFLPNRMPLYLAVPVLLFLCGYSLAKRFTALAHFWLGAALMLSPVAAWIAICGTLDWPPVILGGAVLFWVAGFDIIYACQDYDADQTQGLHSVPARLGVAGALHLAMLCHVGTVLLLALLPLVFAEFGAIYWTGVTAVALLLVYEHALVRPDDLSRVNQAFFQVNAVVSLGLLAVGAADLYW